MRQTTHTRTKDVASLLLIITLATTHVAYLAPEAADLSGANPTNTIVAFDLHDTLLMHNWWHSIRIVLTSGHLFDFFALVTNPFFVADVVRVTRRCHVTEHALDELEKKYPRIARVKQTVYDAANAQDINEGTFAVAQLFKKRGYKITIFSNIGSRMFAQLRLQLFPRFEIFDCFVTAAPPEYIAKPDPRSYERFNTLCNPDHKRVLFIDDNPQFIDGADDTFVPLKFVGANQLSVDVQTLL